MHRILTFFNSIIIIIVIIILHLSLLSSIEAQNDTKRSMEPNIEAEKKQLIKLNISDLPDFKTWIVRHLNFFCSV